MESKLTEKGLDEGAIRAELARITSCPDFDASRRSHAFLRYIVEKALNGSGDSISQYEIATQVFGRPEDFDPTIDPIVRIHAGRLRRSLKLYYLSDGAEDPVRIEIPKGAYVPVFKRVPSLEGPRPETSESGMPAEEGGWPTIVVMPLANLEANPEIDFIASGLTAELANELSLYQDIRVILSPQGNPSDGDVVSPCDKVPVRRSCFAVEGELVQDASETKITVRLLDRSSRNLLWSHSFHAVNGDLSLFRFREEVAQSIAARLADEQGIIAQNIAKATSGKPPTELKTYEAILRYNDYERTYLPEKFEEALTSLRRAIEIEPDCGLAWAYLARLYGGGYGLGFLNEPDALQRTLEYARRGVQLAPNDQRARYILAYAHLLANQLDAGIREIDEAFDLNPSSLVFLDGAAYLLTLLGDWKRGPELLKRAIKANPFHRPVVCQALWYDYFRQGNYELAYVETQRVFVPSLFWSPLTEAATLGQLGRLEEAHAAAKTLLQLKPDFESNARVLIGHYVKFSEIAERIIDGLRKSGLELSG